ncbi:hypothetical protein VE03_10647, partial [Pseudogymnoascus sp. 23342-1-I1]
MLAGKFPFGFSLLPWFLNEEYQVIVNLESATTLDPAAIKVAYEDAARVANLANASMPRMDTALEGA